jgi:hypothetical protein
MELAAKCLKFGLLFGGAVFRMFGEVLAVVVGHFADDLRGGNVKTDTARVDDGDMDGAEQGIGAAEVEFAGDKLVVDSHEGVLDVFGTFEHGGGVEAGVDASADAFDEVGMEVAEELSAEGGRAAAAAVNFDVGAAGRVLCSHVESPWCQLRVPGSEQTHAEAAVLKLRRSSDWQPGVDQNFFRRLNSGECCSYVCMIS